MPANLRNARCFSSCVMLPAAVREAQILDLTGAGADDCCSWPISGSDARLSLRPNRSLSLCRCGSNDEDVSMRKLMGSPALRVVSPLDVVLRRTQEAAAARHRARG
jgi:hypothetical protein